MEGLRLNNLQSRIHAGAALPRGLVSRVGISFRRCPSVHVNAHGRTVAARERVLRYPDGHERRIIYPAIVTLDEDDDEYSSWDVTGLWTGAVQQHQASVIQQVRVLLWFCTPLAVT